MNEMNNFEKACFQACDDWVNSIEIIEEPAYSSKHIKKIKSMANGIRIGNVYMNRNRMMILIACVLILAMNIVAFAYIGSQSKTKSKDLIFYSQNPVKIGSFEGGLGIRVRASGKLNDDKAIDSLEYGYIPEDYSEIFELNPGQQKQLWANANGEYIYYRREFKKQENGGKTSTIFIEKAVESNGMNLRDSAIYVAGDKKGEELKDAVLNNDGVEIVSPDISKFMEQISDFEENRIHYYFIASEYENAVGGELLWNDDGYLYMLTAYDIPLKELVKIAKDVK